MRSRVPVAVVAAGPRPLPLVNFYKVAAPAVVLQRYVRQTRLTLLRGLLTRELARGAPAATFLRNAVLVRVTVARQQQIDMKKNPNTMS